MPKITCTYKDCGKEIPNPCKKIVSLLGLITSLGMNMYRHKTPGSNVLAERENLQASIDRLRKELIEEGVVKLDEQLPLMFSNDKRPIRQRHLTLECIDGHRENYTITCED